MKSVLPLFFGSFLSLVTLAVPTQAQLSREYIFLGNRMFGSLGSGNERPSAISVTPAAATGNGPTILTFVYEDFNGASNLLIVNGIINSAFDGANACYFAYSLAANTLYLVNNPGNDLFTLPLPPGAGPASVENSQCRIYRTGTSASLSGNRLTLSLNTEFLPAFGGRKVAFLAARDVTEPSSTSSSGWQPLGIATVSVPTTPARVDSFLPNRGTGAVNAAQLFEHTFSSTAGFSDISAFSIVVNSALDAARACYYVYVPSGDTIYLVQDNGDSGNLTALPPLLGPFGVFSGSTENSQCKLIGAGSTATKSGNSITLRLNVQFKANFGGNRIVYANTATGQGNSSWQIMGTWTVQ